MGEPPKPAHKRRPNLRDAIEAAEAAGKVVRSAVLESDKLTLLFDDGTNIAGTSDDWDQHLQKLGGLSHGKDKRV